MRCLACSTENPPQAKFCLECAAPLARRCSSCGTVLPEAAKFCMECAQPVATLVMEPSPAASPQSYTPRHLAEKVLAGRDALQGERKQVTVLFADVVGSTALIQGRDAEEAQRLLDGIVQVMMDAVHRYEGTVSRLMGDGLMAMFGAPLAHEDHAVRACFAALAMRDSSRRHADELRRSLGITLTIRVGLGSGEVVVRTIRDDLHMDYTAMGQTVHLASRMEQLAEPGTIALTAETLALVEGFVQVRSLGPVPVKGLDQPLEIYRLLGAGQARTRIQAAAARGLTRFVGRHTEMEALYGALDRARGGDGQVAALVGEPGVGKSRLVWELTHSHRVEGWTILESGSVSYGKATSYLPVIDLLKVYCRIEARDDARTIREKVLGKLLNLDESLRAALPAILTLLDVEVEDATWQALDPAQRRRQTLDALKRLLLRESQEQPLLLVFEDLHWIDSESQTLLDSLVESLPTARILLLVNYRPEYSHSWGSRGAYTQVRVDPLAVESTDELLDGLLGGDATLGPLRALLAARTEGNPLFLEESVRSLVENGLLMGERGAYRLSGPLAAIRVPATVQAVLAARIDRLPPDEKALLQTAAVIGKDVPGALLLAIADGAEDEMRRRLAALQAAEFLYEAALFPELEYTFKHALTHEVAYGSLLRERRRELHARIVDAIERLYADRLAEHVERLAAHALRGEVWETAVAFSRQAGTKAVTRSAHREAISWFEQALSALGHVSPSREVVELEIDLRLELRVALSPVSGIEPALAQLYEARGLAEDLHDQRRLGWILAFIAYSYFQLAQHDRAIDVGQRALSIAEALDDVPLQIVTNLQLGPMYRVCGDYGRAVGCAKWVMAALRDDLIRDRFAHTTYPAIDARNLLTWCLYELGEFAEGIAPGKRQPRSLRRSTIPSGWLSRGTSLASSISREGI